MKIRGGLIFILLFALFLIGCSSDMEQEETEEIEKQEQVTDGKVVTIEDKTFDENDLEFYTLMNQLKVVYQIDVADNDEIEYWEEQKTYYENVNVNLQHMIEFYAMSLLAEEKNYFVPDEKLQKAVEDYKKKMEKSEEATKLIESFGKQEYNRHIEEYIRRMILRDRIAEELKEEIEEENPEASEAEIHYLLEDKFDDLLMDQIYSLEMEIHLK